jgi:cell division protein FtsL
MREAAVEPIVLAKSIDNSGIVREVDPRASRDLLSLLLLVAVLVGSLVLYAWPHFQLRQTAIAADGMQRERERLLEENRKLRLEKASLENLGRVETIALRTLGLVEPPPERTVVVEAPLAPPPRAQVASSRIEKRDARN